MKHLGIDYGAKRVGLALSDGTGTFARPYGILANDDKLLTELAALCQDEAVEAIVLGESRDFKGVPNKIFRASEKFKRALTASLDLPVIWEPEFLTSAQAARATGREALDARAAALILQSYLDRRRAAKKS